MTYVFCFFGGKPNIEHSIFIIVSNELESKMSHGFPNEYIFIMENLVRLQKLNRLWEVNTIFKYKKNAYILTNV